MTATPEEIRATWEECRQRARAHCLNRGDYVYRAIVPRPPPEEWGAGPEATNVLVLTFLFEFDVRGNWQVRCTTGDLIVEQGPHGTLPL